MTRTVFVHCGLHKTGTTAIQAALLASRDKLLEHGVLYPAGGGNETGHPNLAWEIVGDNRFDPGGLTLDHVIGQIAAFSGNVVLSSEDFETLLAPPWRLQRMLDRLRGTGSEVCLVIYARDETAYAESLFIELLKHGYSTSFAGFMRQIRSTGRLQFRAWTFQFEYTRVAASLAALPRLRVIWRSYEQAARSGSVVADFLSVIGVDSALVGETAGQRLNSRVAVQDSISRFCGNRLNRAVHASESAAIARLSGRLGSRRLAAGPRFQLGASPVSSPPGTPRLARVCSASDGVRHWRAGPLWRIGGPAGKPADLLVDRPVAMAIGFSRLFDKNVLT